jgi:hypothetical protein
MTGPSRRQVRNHLDQALAEFADRRGRLVDLGTPHDRLHLAGVLRDAYLTQIAELEARAENAETAAARIRAVCQAAGETGTVPTRSILDALYGEDR